MTDRVDLHTTRSAYGAFLPRDETSAAPYLATAVDTTCQPVFSYRNSQPSILQAAIDLIHSARQKIFVASFRLGENAINDALQTAANRLNGRVYVVTAWDDRALTRGFGELAALEDIELVDLAAIEAQNKRFEQMTKAGIFIRGHHSCHAKFVVADDERALVCSANLEASALTGARGRAVTGELGVVLQGRKRVEPLGRLFARLWKQSSGEARPGATYALRQRQPDGDLQALPAPDVDQPTVIWTYDDDARHIVETVRNIAGMADDKLVMASFSLTKLTTAPEWIIDPLSSAIARGVSVDLLVRGRNFSSHCQQAQALADLGINIFADSLTHAKGIVADGRQGAIFSANLDLDHGLLGGIEVGVCLGDGPALREIHRYLRHAMAHANMTFVPRPTQDELNIGHPARWHRRWPHGKDISVCADDGGWRRLAEAAGSTPALFAQVGEDCEIYVGGGTWRLSPGTPAARLTLIDRPCNPQQTIDVLDAWSMFAGARGDAVRSSRGFVSAVFTRTPADASASLVNDDVARL